MNVPMKMLSVTLVIVLCQSYVFGVPVSNKLIKGLSLSANENSNLDEGHKLHRRSFGDGDDMVASETGYMLHNFLPYPNSNHGPYPGQYIPPFGNHYSRLIGGSYSQHHHVVNHDYPENRHYYYHHHNYPHDHHKCNFDGSSESGYSGEDRNEVTLPYPGKFTPPPLQPGKVPPSPTPSVKPSSNTPTTEPTYDIDVRRGEAGK